MFKHEEDIYFFIFEFFLFLFCFFQLGSTITKKEIKISNHFENKIEKKNYPIVFENKKEIKNDNIQYINFNDKKINKKNIQIKKQIFLKKPEITSFENDDADTIWYEEN